MYLGDKVWLWERFGVTVLFYRHGIKLYGLRHTPVTDICPRMFSVGIGWGRLEFVL